MLSAVAARKARLATNPAAVPAASPSPPSPSSTPKPGIPPSKPPSKRKPAEHTAIPPSKRKRYPHPSRARKDDGRARYFQEDAFKQQDDVIIVDDDDDEESDALDGEMPGGELNAHVLAELKKKKSKPRAWSPSAPLPDSSDSDDEEDSEVSLVAPVDLGLAVEPAIAEPEETSILSTFRPTLDQNVFNLSPSETSMFSLPRPEDNSGTVLLMSAGETLTLLGTYCLTVLQGTISLAGMLLSASRVPHRVFAPRSSPLPVIQCQQLDPPPAGLELPTRIRESARGKDSVILLQELRTDVEGLGRICRTFEGVFGLSRWQKNAPSFDLGLQGVHLITQRSPGTSTHTTLPSWESELSSVLEHDKDANDRRIYLVKGPRNSGKSTFAKSLVNRLLCRYRKVAYLECDLGQSEFTPGGMVALNIVDSHVFGPSFTHQSIPYAAQFMGATSPRNSPAHYLDSIQALVQTYNMDVQNAGLLEDNESSPAEDDRLIDFIPLVVNTMGWTKGLGTNLLKRIEEIVEPSDIYELGSLSVEDPPSRSQPPVKLHSIEAILDDTLSNYFTAVDHRTISILSYFHAVFPPHARPGTLQSTTALSWQTTTPLVARPPYEIDWKLGFDKVCFSGAGMEDIVAQEAARVLNGAVVGLLNVDPDTLDQDQPSTEVPLLPYTQGAAPPSPFISTCTGLALVRSVSSPPATLLRMLTPLTPASLATARVIVKGDMELPIWGMLDFRSSDMGEVAGCEREKVPYLRWGKGEGVGAERRRVRRNLMRRGQM